MDLEAMVEAERRGLLSPEQTAMLAEARNRGLVGGAAPAPAQPEQQPERGIGQVIYDNLIGDPNDGVNSFGERAGTWLNRAGETMTLGTVGDEAAAGVTGMLPGRTYEGELERYRGNEEAMSGLGRTSADLTGGVAGALGSMLIPGAGPALATAGTSGRGAGLAATLGRGMATGAGMGGVYGFMEGEGGAADRAQEGAQGAALGGAVGGATAGLGRIVQSLMDRRAGNVAIREAARGAPTTEEMRRAASEGYDLIDQAGVQVRPERFADFMGQTRQTLMDEGLDVLPQANSQSLTPRSARVMDIGNSMVSRMDDAAQAGQNPGLPLRSIDQFRRHAGTAAAQVSPDARTDARLGSMAIGAVDDFVAGLGPDDVLAGDVEMAQQLLPQVRDLYARMSRSQLLDDAIENSENYLSGGASGIRNQFARIVRNPRLSRGFSEAELAVMNRVAQGTIPERLLYNLGSGMGQIASTAVGGALGGTTGLPGMLGGAAAGAAVSGGLSRAGGAVANRNAEIARAIVANGRLPAQLPVADEGMRRVMEALALRSGAVGAQ
jgi:hypothetical protein